jgi:hypothetical protein
LSFSVSRKIVDLLCSGKEIRVPEF